MQVKPVTFLVGRKGYRGQHGWVIPRSPVTTALYAVWQDGCAITVYESNDGRDMKFEVLVRSV